MTVDRFAGMRMYERVLALTLDSDTGTIASETAHAAACIPIADLDGYRARAPRMAGVAADDRQYCETSACPACGREGREFRPFVRGEGTAEYSYRFFAKCNCGFIEES